MYSRRLPNGFSFVELIMTISVFMVLVTGAMISYRQFSLRQQVIQSAKNIQQILREAQKKSRVGEKPSGCDSLRGYRVRGTTGSPTLTMTAVCSPTSPSTVISSIDLVGNARLTQNLDVTYKILAGGVSWNGIVRVQTASTNQYQFEIEPGGGISEGE